MLIRREWHLSKIGNYVDFDLGTINTNLVNVEDTFFPENPIAWCKERDIPFRD